MKRLLELVALTIVYSVICLIYQNQPTMSFNEGFGWDGVYYKNITTQMLQGADPISAEDPFVRRPGTPFLVARYAEATGTDVLHSAIAVNLAGMYLASVFLYLWLCFFFERFWLKGLLSLLFMLAWYLPLRVIFHDPMATDAWGIAWFMAGLLLLPQIRRLFEKKSYRSLIGLLVAFSLIVSMGSLFRESNVVLFVALFFVLNPLKYFKPLFSGYFTCSKVGEALRCTVKSYLDKRVLILFIPLIFIVLAKVFLARHVVVEESDYSYIKTVFKWFYSKSLPEFLLGIFHACGPLVMLLPFFRKEIWGVLWEKQEFLFLLFVAFVFGLIGGSDTERIFFESAFPFVLIWMGYAILALVKTSAKWWFYVLLALQTVAFRLYWNLPDYPSDNWRVPFPFFGIPGSDFQYLFLYSHHGQYILNSILFAEYVFLFLATWFVLSRRSNTTSSIPVVE